MSGTRISKRVVDSVRPNGSEFIVWDDSLTGFGLRVRASGAKSYVVVYRAGTGRKAPVRKVTLGSTKKLRPTLPALWRKRRLDLSPMGRTRPRNARKIVRGSPSRSWSKPSWRGTRN
jgi:hypothetical protein